MNFIPDQLKVRQVKRNSPIVWVLLIIFLVVFTLTTWIITSAIQENKQKNIKAIASNSGHFLNENALPDLSKEGVQCSITEAYYTKDNDLMLKLKLSNGTTNSEHLKTLDITLKNEKEETIAIAGTDVIDPNFIVPAGGYSDMTFYVPPEYIFIKNDDLDTLSCIIKIT